MTVEISYMLQGTHYNATTQNPVAACKWKPRNKEGLIIRHTGCHTQDCTVYGKGSIINGYGNHFIRPTDEVIDDIIRRVDKMYYWTPSKKMDYTKRVLTDRGYTVDEETVSRIQMQVIKWKLRNY